MSHASSDESTAVEPFPDLSDDPPAGTDATAAPVPVPPVFRRRGSSNSRRARVHYALDVDTTNMPPSSSSNFPLSPSQSIRRRNTRSNTFRTLEEFEDYERRPGWRPGAEQGVDPLMPNGGQDSVPNLQAVCQITVVDFSTKDLEIHELDNAGIIDFIKNPQPSWVKCRWINVNGLSWDVIQALGRYKKLHRLAIEDIMNTRNRTKADWFTDHAFIILTCQKLVRIIDDDDSSDEEAEDYNRRSAKSRSSVGTMKKLRQWVSGKKLEHPTAASMMERGKRPELTPGHSFIHQPTGYSDVFDPNNLCTLQRYHAPPNAARTEFMEKHSALAPKGLAVMAEQVAIFITSDNTVIAFFEQSADDVETPILNRLKSKTTIIRQSCDASMVAQSIIDAIIDMAIPVAACYADMIGDLELDVLTNPNVKHTKKLYIIISEINKMFSFVNPILSLINGLRDHKTKLAPEAIPKELQNPLQGVIITPITYTYLGDVYDHCVLITENLSQIKESANHMIDLIFNTIATSQNESMKQLTIATIIFLPLTFLTGYFGQNFDSFDSVRGDVTFFWKIAAPIVIATILVLMRDAIVQWVERLFQRRHIGKRRRRSQKSKKTRR